MTTQYKLQKNGATNEVCAVEIVGAGKSIPFDDANTDFVEYQRWLAEGNVPLPADEQE